MLERFVAGYTPISSGINSPSVRDLGVYIDADLWMRTHVAKTTISLRAASVQCGCIPPDLKRSAIVAIVWDTDAGRIACVVNILHYIWQRDFPGYLLCRLQSVFNAAARVISGLQHSAHITTTLANLHWLHSRRRTLQVQTAWRLFTFRCLQRSARLGSSLPFCWLHPSYWCTVWSTCISVHKHFYYYRRFYRIAVSQRAWQRKAVLRATSQVKALVWFILRSCQHVDGYVDGRSQMVHTDERTQVHTARSSLAVTHPSTNRGRRCLTSMNVPLSQPWSSA